MRWVVDEPADLEFVREVFDSLYPFGPAFSREDVFDLLQERPELAYVNAAAGVGRPQMIERIAA